MNRGTEPTPSPVPSPALVDLDAIASSAAKTSESVDAMARTTQSDVDDVETLASKVIDAISRANELDECLDTTE